MCTLVITSNARIASEMARGLGGPDAKFASYFSTLCGFRADRVFIREPARHVMDEDPDFVARFQDWFTQVVHQRLVPGGKIIWF